MRCAHAKLLLASWTVGLCLAQRASGESIPIRNPSFEYPVLSACQYTYPSMPADSDWTSQSLAGLFNPSPCYLTSAASGNQVIWCNDQGRVKQALTTHVEPNATYTLRVMVARRDCCAADRAGIALFAGGVEIASALFSGPQLPEPNVWGPVTLVATTGPEVNGGLLEVHLFAAVLARGKQVSFDDVSLNVQRPCAADFNRDGTGDFFDYLDFAAAFASDDLSADVNLDGVIDFFDYLDFALAFDIGC
ncbi:MAG: hypothetical protein SFZ23_15060 [Planctomycetota bacterium]|nr:hypothetical protein [Planctomycetota bacterium]